jgi:hypothetical protein
MANGGGRQYLRGRHGTKILNEELDLMAGGGEEAVAEADAGCPCLLPASNV